MTETLRKLISPLRARRHSVRHRARRIRAPRLRALAASLACLLILPLLAVMSSKEGLAAGSPEQRLESEIKAAFLYQFGAYIEWPGEVSMEPEEPIVIGVMDAEDVAGPLSQIVRNRTVRGRPVQMRRLQPGEDPAGVHLLYIGTDVRASVASAVISRLRGEPVVTVTQADHVRDGVITFVIEQNRVRFDVDLGQARAAGIRISSRLLSVARNVSEGEP